MRAPTAASPAATSAAAPVGGAARGCRISAMALTNCPGSFADFLAPVTVEQFRRDYLDRAPLHIPGGPGKFADVMSWPDLNRLLDMSGLWSAQSLSLALDCKIIAQEE